MIEVGEVRYCVPVTTSGSEGWSRKLRELEVWAEENFKDQCYVAKPKPTERIFVFYNEEDAAAFKLMWS